MIYPQHDKHFERLPRPTGQGVEKLVELISVARVQPRTSKGITDLLLPQTSICFNTDSPSKKRKARSQLGIHTGCEGEGRKERGENPSPTLPATHTHTRVFDRSLTVDYLAG